LDAFSRLEDSLATLQPPEAQLEAIINWLLKLYHLNGIILCNHKKSSLFYAGSINPNGLDPQALASYASSLPLEAAFIYEDKIHLNPPGLLPFLHFPLFDLEARHLASLFIFGLKPQDYLKAKQNELKIVMSKIKDILLIEQLKRKPSFPKVAKDPSSTLPFKLNPEIRISALQFIEQMNYPMFLMDEDCNLLAANSALLTKLRFPNLTEFLKGNDLLKDLAVRAELLEIIAREGGVRARRLNCHTRLGEELVLSLSLTRVDDILVGSLFDVSEFIKVAEELRKSLKMQEFLNDRLINSALVLHKTQSSAIRSLARLAEYRDHETGDHLQRIREYSRLLAEEIYLRQPYSFKIRSEYCDDIFLSSMLHDIGKVTIPDQILLKQSKLTDEEWAIMKSHTVIGWTILNQADCELGEQSFLTMASQIALNHHERWDGSGYPNGLAGDKIPLSARISAIADVYDALTSQRPYKKPWHHDEAIKEIRAQAGVAFDPVLIDILMSVEKKMLDIHYRFPK